MREIAFTTMWWTAGWAVAGLFLGVAMMLGKVPPIAEPGAPGSVLFYAFWIPLCCGFGALFGLLLGLIYACLFAVIGPWSEGSSLSFIVDYGGRLFCGAIAGGAIGFATFRNRNGLYVAAAGVISAAVSGYLNRARNTPESN